MLLVLFLLHDVTSPATLTSACARAAYTAIASLQADGEDTVMEDHATAVTIQLHTKARSAPLKQHGGGTTHTVHGGIEQPPRRAAQPAPGPWRRC